MIETLKIVAAVGIVASSVFCLLTMAAAHLYQKSLDQLQAEEGDKG